MTATVQQLPYLDTHVAEFLDDPNRFLGDGPERIRVARGRSGIEFFGYDTVREMFRERRISPRTPQHFLDKGVTGGPILDYLVHGNLNLTWPDVHDRLRPILMTGFRPRRIEQAREQMRTLAEHLVDRLAERETCNVVMD